MQPQTLCPMQMPHLHPGLSPGPPAIAHYAGDLPGWIMTRTKARLPFRARLADAQTGACEQGAPGLPWLSSLAVNAGAPILSFSPN